MANLQQCVALMFYVYMNMRMVFWTTARGEDERWRRSSRKSCKDAPHAVAQRGERTTGASVCINMYYDLFPARSTALPACLMYHWSSSLAIVLYLLTDVCSSRQSTPTPTLHKQRCTRRLVGCVYLSTPPTSGNSTLSQCRP